MLSGEKWPQMINWQFRGSADQWLPPYCRICLLGLCIDGGRLVSILLQLIANMFLISLDGPVVKVSVCSTVLFIEQLLWWFTTGIGIWKILWWFLLPTNKDNSINNLMIISYCNRKTFTINARLTNRFFPCVFFIISWAVRVWKE